MPGEVRQNPFQLLLDEGRDKLDDKCEFNPHFQKEVATNNKKALEMSTFAKEVHDID